MSKQSVLMYVGVLLIAMAIGWYFFFFRQVPRVTPELSGELIISDVVAAKLPQDLPPHLKSKLEQRIDLRDLSEEELKELEFYFESKGMLSQEFQDSDADGYSDEVEEMIGLNPRKQNSGEDIHKILR